MFSRIVVGVDFATGGDDAIGLATALASDDGQLILAHVVMSNPTVFHPADADTGDRERLRSIELLDRERRLMRLNDPRVDGLELTVASLCAASVRRGLHFIACTRQADLIVVGTCQRRQLSRLLLRDDTSSIMRHPPCPVAIAPAGYSTASHTMVNAHENRSHTRPDAAISGISDP